MNIVKNPHSDVRIFNIRQTKLFFLEAYGIAMASNTTS